MGVPLGSTVGRLLCVQFVMSASHFMVVPILAVYLSNLGHGPFEIATIVTLLVFSARLLTVVTGPLADLHGTRFLVAIGLAGRAIGLFGFFQFSDWQVLSVFALVAGFGAAAFESGSYRWFASRQDKESRRAFVMNNQALNLGVIVGPVLGMGLLFLLEEPQEIFLAAGLVFVVLLVVLPFLQLPSLGRVKGPARANRVGPLADRRFLFFVATTLPWWVLFSQLYVSLPILAVEFGGGTNSSNLMFLVNGVVGFVFAFASLALFDALPPAVLVLGSYAFLTIVFVLAPLSEAFFWFLIVVGLYTLGETLILPAIRATVAEMARAGSEATFLGFSNIAWVVGGAVGTYVGSWLVVQNSAEWMFLGFALVAGVGLAGSVAFQRYREPLHGSGSRTLLSGR